MNFTDFPITENLDTFNPTCAPEIEKIITRCANFKLEVFNTMETRFIISLVVMSLLVLFRIVTINRPFKFQETEFYKEQVQLRIDLIIIILLIFNLGYLFIF